MTQAANTNEVAIAKLSASRPLYMTLAAVNTGLYATTPEIAAAIGDIPRKSIAGALRKLVNMGVVSKDGDTVKSTADGKVLVDAEKESHLQSKAARSRAIMAANRKAPRKDIIARYMSELDLSKQGASTYHENAKKELVKLDNLTSVDAEVEA